MATREVKVKVLECDIHRSRVEGQTVLIIIERNGKRVGRKVDLCPEHDGKFDKALKPFLAKSRPARLHRKTTNGPAPKPAKRSRKATKKTAKRTTRRETPEQRQAIRDWARGKGYTVGDRGRISDEIRAEYRKDRRNKRRRTKA